MSLRRPALSLTVAAAVTNLLAYVFFALVVRSLGAAQAAPVSVLWTFWGFVAAAVTFPVQHWITRSAAATHGAATLRRAVAEIVLSACGVAVVLGFASWAGAHALFQRDGVAFPLLVAVVTLGSALAGVARGLLSAASRWATLGTVLVAENLVRCLLATVLIAGGSQDARAFGVALACGQLVYLAFPRLLSVGAGDPAPAWRHFVATLAGGQFLSQSVLTGGPLVLASLGGDRAEITGLVGALALFRAPYSLALPLTAGLTGPLTTLVRAGRESQLRTFLLWTCAGTAVAGLVAALLGTVLGPAVVALVFGHSASLPASVTCAVAAGSAAVVGTLPLSILAIARNRPTTSTAAWLVAVVVAAGVVVAGPGTPTFSVALAFAVAESAAFIVLAAGVRGRRVSGVGAA